jgi:hypothetical protein
MVPLCGTTSEGDSNLAPVCPPRSPGGCARQSRAVSRPRRIKEASWRPRRRRPRPAAVRGAAPATIHPMKLRSRYRRADHGAAQGSDRPARRPARPAWPSPTSTARSAGQSRWWAADDRALKVLVHEVSAHLEPMCHAGDRSRDRRRCGRRGLYPYHESHR